MTFIKKRNRAQSLECIFSRRGERKGSMPTLGETLVETLLETQVETLVETLVETQVTPIRFLALPCDLLHELASLTTDTLHVNTI